MLTLHRQTRTIITDESFSVILKWINPCCYMDSIIGDVGLGIEISVNEFTRTEFGNPDRFEKLRSAVDRKFPDVSIRFDGVLLMSGTLVITDATDESYSGWLQSELGVLGTKQRDKFINEMPFKTGVAFDPETPATAEYACVTVYNPNFWDGIGREVDDPRKHYDENGVLVQNDGKITYLAERLFTLHHGYINRLDNEFHIITTGIDPETSVASVDGCVVSPYLNLYYVIKEVLRMNDFFVIDSANILTNPFAQVLLYNNFNIFKQDFTTEEQEFTYWDYDLNEMVGMGSFYTVTSMAWSLDTFNYADLVPRISLKDFLLSIQNRLNLVFHFRNDKSVALINRNDVPNADPYDLDEYFVGTWKIGEQKNVSLKFTEELEQNDQLISENWHDLSERRANYKDPVANKAVLLAVTGSELGDLRLVKDEFKIYEYKWAVFEATTDKYVGEQTDILEWVVASIVPQPYFYGDAEEIEEIKTSCSKLAGSVLPRTAQRGNVGSARSLWSDFSFRLLPYGFNAFDEDVLDFDGETGLFNLFWKNWAHFWKTRLPVEAQFMIPLNVLVYIINNITQPYRTRHGKFIIEELECEFQGNLMGLVKVKGYKI